MSLENLPVEWIISNVGQVLNNTNNLRKPVSSKEREKIKGDYPYYGATGKIDSLNSYTHDGEYILMGEDGANLLSRVKDQAFVVKGKFWVNNHAHSLQSSCGMPSNFFAYYLNQIDLRPFITGSAQPKLTRQNLDAIPVVVVPLAEQQEIVRQLDVMLSQVEQIKARLDAIPAILKKFRQSVLADAVSGKLIEQDFNELPLESFSHYLTDVRYGTSKKCFEDLVDDVPVLRIPNIGDNGSLDFTNLKYAEFDSKEINQLQLTKGDLLLIRSNGSLDLVGKSAIVDQLDRTVLYAGYLIRLRFTDAVNPQFIQYYLKSPQTRQIIENIARSTSGVNNINSKEIASLKIHLPNIDVQNNIVDRVKQLLGFSSRIEATVQLAQKRVNLLTQSILAKAFSGELTAEWREQHQDLITGVNSAEALLAKIQVEREASKPVKKTRAKKEA